MNGCTVTFEGDHGETYDVAANLVGYIDSNLIKNKINKFIINSVQNAKRSRHITSQE